MSEYYFDNLFEFADIIKDTDTETYKMACEYMAKTEVYDRTLTDARSPWDKTEAFIDISPRIRHFSRVYAGNLRKYYEELCGGSWRPIQEEIIKHSKYSAQQWIDEYNRLTGKSEEEE